MASESVATKHGQVSAATGSKHDLWIADTVLTVQIDKSCHEFPPDLEHCDAIAGMIQGLARAAKAVAFYAENEKGDTAFMMQPIGDIASAIMLLSQLSSAIRHESSGVAAREALA